MNTMKLAIIASVLSLTPTLSLAQQTSSQELLKRYCTGDYLEHCSEFAPGGPEIEACFSKKAKDLSPNCSAAIVVYQQERGAIRKISSTR